MRYKDMPKIHEGITDGYTLEHSVKGSLTPIKVEPAALERREEDSYSKAIEEVQWQLQDIKKDMPKIHEGITDGYTLEHSVKGSLTPIKVEPAVIERREEDSYSKAIADVQWQLQDIKKDIQKIKDIVDSMDKNGLKMKTQW